MPGLAAKLYEYGMKQRTVIALAALMVWGLGFGAGAAMARDCRVNCAVAGPYRIAELDTEKRMRPPIARAPGLSGAILDERARTTQPAAREPLTDKQIWAIVKARVPGKIVNARLRGQFYSFRIISNRGSIVDLVVDRYTGRVATRPGP